MDNKKTTVALSILLVLLIILLFLKSCGRLPWLQEPDNQNWLVPLQQEARYEEEDVLSDSDSSASPAVALSTYAAPAAAVIEDIAALPADSSNIDDKSLKKAEVSSTKPADIDNNNDLKKTETSLPKPTAVDDNKLKKIDDKISKKAEASLPKTAAVSASKSKPAESSSPKKKDASAASVSANKQDLPQSVTKKPKKESGDVPVYINTTGFRPFYVYTEVGSKDNHYYPYGLMG
ncbi:MAG: hypothetical protein LBQ47_06445, partial [Endomicrobium sp.]|nr:hypothetical protein [Endomicrobium sp.]